MEPAKAEVALRGLEALIVGSVSNRLRGWPAERRKDVEQETRLKLWRVFTSDKVIDNTAAFATRVVNNAISDALREFAKRRGIVVLNHEYGIKNDPADNAAMNDLVLTPAQQVLLDLFNELGSAAAIAERLGLPRQTISERLSRLRRAIKENQAA